MSAATGPLTRPELKALLAERGWSADACFLDEQPVRADTVVLAPAEDGWDVYLVGERASAVEQTRRHFEDEAEALAYLLTKLEQNDRARRALSRARQHD